MFSTRLLSLLVACAVAILYCSSVYPVSYALAQNPTTDPDSPTNNEPQYPDVDSPTNDPVDPGLSTVDPGTVDPVDPGLSTVDPGTVDPGNDLGGSDSDPNGINPPEIGEIFPWVIIATIVIVGVVAVGKSINRRSNKPKMKIPPSALVEIRTNGGIDR